MLRRSAKAVTTVLLALFISGSECDQAVIAGILLGEITIEGDNVTISEDSPLRDLSMTLVSGGTRIGVPIGSDGRFEARDIPLGQYEAEFGGVPNFLNRPIELGVRFASDEQEVRRDFDFSYRRESSVSGSVISNYSLLGPRPFEDAEVELNGPDGTRTTMTDENGDYSFGNLRVGGYNVGVKQDPFHNFAQPSFEFNVDFGIDYEFDFEGDEVPSNRLDVRAEMADGSPVPGVDFELSADGFDTQNGMSAADGLFSYTGLPVGGFNLRVSFGGNLQVEDPERQVNFDAPGQTKTETFTLSIPTGGINGRVEKNGGVGLADIPVRAWGPVNVETTTNDDGDFALDGLPHGTYSVWAIPEEGSGVHIVDEQQDVTVGPNMVPVVNFFGALLAELFNIGDIDFTFTHDVGSTSCPQDLGTFTLSNTTGLAGSFTIDTKGLPVIASPASGTLPADGSPVMISLQFDCSTTSSFNGTIDIIGMVDGVLWIKSLAVNATIN